MIFRGVFNLDRHGRARKHSIGFACNDESQRYSQTESEGGGGGRVNKNCTNSLARVAEISNRCTSRRRRNEGARGRGRRRDARVSGNNPRLLAAVVSPVEKKKGD